MLPLKGRQPELFGKIKWRTILKPVLIFFVNGLFVRRFYRQS